MSRIIIPSISSHQSHLNWLLWHTVLLVFTFSERVRKEAPSSFQTYGQERQYGQASAWCVYCAKCMAILADRWSQQRESRGVINEGLWYFPPFLVYFPNPWGWFSNSWRASGWLHMKFSIWCLHLGMTKMSGISGPMAAAGLSEAAESNSNWATGGIEDPKEYTRHSAFSHNKIWGEKGKPFWGNLTMHFETGLSLIHRSRETYCTQLLLQITLMRQYKGGSVAEILMCLNMESWDACQGTSIKYRSTKRC